MQGKVKWFNPSKGYGFIVQNIKGSKDVFVHHTAIVGEGYKSLKEGDIVEFTIVDGPKGLQANEVVIVKEITCLIKKSH